LLALSITRSCSFLVPTLCGRRIIWKVQDCPGCNCASMWNIGTGQVVLAITKSAPIFHPLIVSTPGPLVSVTVCAAEFWNTVTDPKFNGEGSSVVAEGIVAGVGVAVGATVAVEVGVAVRVGDGVGVRVVVAVAVAVAVVVDV